LVPLPGLPELIFFAFDLLDVGDPAFFQDNHLQQVGVHDGHGQDIMLFAFEF
jgi:hypothetical protein